MSPTAELNFLCARFVSQAMVPPPTTPTVLPPPPPPSSAQGPASSAANSPATAVKPRISPPSVLRGSGRGASKNSVAFRGITESLGDVLPPSDGRQMPPAASLTACGTSSAAPSSSGRHKVVASQQTISLDTVVSSQFEDEATTHILAALELEEVEKEGNQSRLLGEGIEGMEDYSDDDDDDGGEEGGGGGKEKPRARSRTFGNDSFLRKIASYNVAGYDDPGSPADASLTSQRDAGDLGRQPERHRRYVSSPSYEGDVVGPPQRHKRFASSLSAAYLPAVPDDAALELDAAGRDTLEFHIQSDHAEGGEDPFLEGAKSVQKKAGVVPGADPFDEERAGEGADGGRSEATTDESQGDGKKKDPGTENTLTDTEATDDLHFMARRLRLLQKKRPSLTRASSRRSIASGGSGHGGGGGGGESSGDRLIDALNSVDSSKDKSFWSKVKMEYHELIAPKLPAFCASASHTLLFVIFPSVAVAGVLFYMFDNPMAGDTGTSISWWILFLGARQTLIFELTRVGEVFWVEILALRSKLFNVAVGPYVSLTIIQSQGWPYIICFWAVMDFVFLYGDHRFPKHWLFWQNKLDIFNAGNPVVGVTDDEFYLRILGCLVFVGVTVSLKRLLLAIFLGRRKVRHFGSELEKLMAKMILIAEVANLARDIENKRSVFARALSPVGEEDDDKLVRFREYMREDYSSTEESPSPHALKRKVLESPAATPGSASHSPGMTKRKAFEHPTPGGSTAKVSPGSLNQGASPGGKQFAASHGQSPPRPPPIRTGSSMEQTAESVKKKVDLNSTAKMKLLHLLEEWEEPELISGTHVSALRCYYFASYPNAHKPSPLNSLEKSKATVRDLVQFQKAASIMDDKYPFSHAFGRAKTREMCCRSSQEVFDRLMFSAMDSSVLSFSIISILAMDEAGDYQDAKIKSLIRLFRPDRDGNLSKLDFVKSIDTVYKQLRLLRASIANSGQIDTSFERIVNWFFYFFMSIIALTILGVSNIWTVFLSFNTFFLGFSFLFGAAASNYFEGLLLISLYFCVSIGDRIATSAPNKDTNPNGSSTWFVDSVTLFTTTVRFATTNEVATYSNGSLAVLRIINANRSSKAIISILIKFGLETPFHKISVFRTAVENFIKARPREWIALAGFRATRVEADYGYIEYKIIAQHRESWQNVGPVLQSKADLSSFCLEATKKLAIKYESPPMPVNLSTSDSLDFSGVLHGEADEPADIGNKSISAEDLQEVANLFEIRKKKK
ncbi:hypothetical protein ACHAWF_011515 [Thalassiosira exigua]